MHVFVHTNKLIISGAPPHGFSSVSVPGMTLCVPPIPPSRNFLLALLPRRRWRSNHHLLLLGALFFSTSFCFRGLSFRGVDHRDRPWCRPEHHCPRPGGLSFRGVDHDRVCAVFVRRLEGFGILRHRSVRLTHLLKSLDRFVFELSSLLGGRIWCVEAERGDVI